MQAQDLKQKIIQQCQSACAIEQPSPKKTTFISTFFSQYQSTVPKIGSQMLQKKRDALNKGGFIKLSHFHEFRSQIMDATDDSVLYEVYYGYYKTKISAYISNLDLQQIQRSFLGQGKNGKVFWLKYGEKSFVSKVLFKEKENLFVEDKFLKEIFISKFASALEIGPQFLQIYGYDILSLNKTCEFLLSFCKTNLQKQAKEHIRENILENMSILHEFGGVHCDIKPENIAWEPSRKKFIFLDFGLSLFITEDKGYKTNTLFRGSFNFTSKEMQAAFYLKKTVAVDLYYNDLFGAIKSLEIISKDVDMLHHQQSSSVEDINSKNKSQWQQLISFFQLNYYFFKKSEKQICELAQREKYLLLSFKKIVHEKISIENQRLKILNILEKNWNEEFSSMSFQEVLEADTPDSILYRQISLNNKKIYQIFEANQNNIRMLNFRRSVRDVWGKKPWTEKMFELIYEANFQQQNKKEQPQFLSLVQTINELEARGTGPVSFEEKYLNVLKMFRTYFIENEDTESIFKIQTIFYSLFLFDDAAETNENNQQIIINNKQTYLYFKNLNLKLGWFIYLHKTNRDLMFQVFQNFTPISQNPLHNHILNIYLQLMTISFRRGCSQYLDLTSLWDKVLLLSQFSKTQTSQQEYTKTKSLCMYCCDLFMKQHSNIKLGVLKEQICEAVIQKAQAQLSNPQLFHVRKILSVRMFQFHEFLQAEKNSNFKLDTNSKKLFPFTTLWDMPILIRNKKFNAVREILQDKIINSPNNQADLLQQIYIEFGESLFICLKNRTISLADILNKAVSFSISENFMDPSLLIPKINTLMMNILSFWGSLMNICSGEIVLSFQDKILHLLNYLEQYIGSSLKNQPHLYHPINKFMSALFLISSKTKDEIPLYKNLLEFLENVYENPDLNQFLLTAFLLLQCLQHYFPKFVYKKMRDLILQKFEKIQLQSAVVFFSNCYVSSFLIATLIANRSYQRLQKNMLQLSFFANEKFLTHKKVNYEFFVRIYKVIPEQQILLFTRNQILPRPIHTACSQCITFLIHVIFLYTPNSFQENEQKKLIRMLGLGIKLAISSHKKRKEVVVFIYKWLKKHDGEMRVRKKGMIHLRIGRMGGEESSERMAKEVRMLRGSKEKKVLRKYLQKKVQVMEQNKKQGS